MSTQEQAIRYLEEHIPELANAATKQAYWQALAAGSSVLERANDSWWKCFPMVAARLLNPCPHKHRHNPVND